MKKSEIQAFWSQVLKTGKRTPQIELTILTNLEWESRIVIAICPISKLMNDIEFVSLAIHAKNYIGPITPEFGDDFLELIQVNPNPILPSEILSLFEGYRGALEGKGVWNTIQPDGTGWLVYRRWDEYLTVYQAGENWIGFFWETFA